MVADTLFCILLCSVNASWRHFHICIYDHLTFLMSILVTFSNILCECTIIYLLLWTFKLFMSLYLQWISCRQHICDWVLLCFPNQTISAFNWGYLEHLHCVITNIIMTIIFLFSFFSIWPISYLFPFLYFSAFFGLSIFVFPFYFCWFINYKSLFC